jgi:hypothetical protein
MVGRELRQVNEDRAVGGVSTGQFRSLRGFELERDVIRKFWSELPLEPLCIMRQVLSGNFC